MIEKEWVIKSRGEEKTITLLADQLNIGPTLSNLLVQRGVTTYDEAKAFFRPSLENLHDPFLMRVPDIFHSYN